MSKRNLAILIVFITLILDQLTKVYVKTHFYMGEEINIFGLDWLRVHFTENNGMAWGMEYGGKTGKLFLTVFRIVAVGVIIYWLKDVIEKVTHNGVTIAVSLILSGAIGNIIDCVFYGRIFNTPEGKGLATLFSDEPYGEFMYGKVVDMIYLPFYQGESFTFFNAIFNGADSWISIGVVLLFIYHKQAFPAKK